MSDEVAPLPAPSGEPVAGRLPSPADAPWDLQVNRTRVLFGEGRLADLGRLVRQLGGRRVLLVTDPGLIRVGHGLEAENSLRKEMLQVVVFHGVEENPTTEHVAAGAAVARKQEVDFIVGLGGGSSMDCAKGINFIVSNGGRMEDYRGINRATRPMLTSVGVPTTAGTGSEAQAYALIARAADKEKMACGDEKARFQGVILDPGLLTSVPPAVAAVAGLDAVAHAVESFVARPAGAQARLYSGEAWRLLSGHLEDALLARTDASAWGRVLWGAHLAGIGIDRAMLGAAHACANPLTARCAIPHGIAVALMLPHVVRFNGQDKETAAAYAELQARGGIRGGTPEELARRIEMLRTACGMPSTLEEAGVDVSLLDEMSTEAAGQWTAGFNPRPVAVGEMRQLYGEAC